MREYLPFLSGILALALAVWAYFSFLTSVQAEPYIKPQFYLVEPSPGISCSVVLQAGEVRGFACFPIPKGYQPTSQRLKLHVSR